MLTVLVESLAVNSSDDFLHYEDSHRMNGSACELFQVASDTLSLNQLSYF